MNDVKIDAKTRQFLLAAQESEITEYYVYSRLAQHTKKEENKKVLQRIADEEKGHYEFWKKYTQKEVRPNWLKVRLFYWTSRFLGLTFGAKLMEKGENAAQRNYDEIIDIVPEARKVQQDEENHEKELLNMINEQSLNYVGSVVLGLNDALVELTGALAGLTFALQNTQLIAMAGFITGVAASMSMAASEYLSTKADGEPTREAIRSSTYTGIAYFVTVLLLITPYLILDHYLWCLATTLVIALFIIFFFNFYISIAKDYNFKHRFFEMAGLSLGVAAISFGIGVLTRMWFGIEV